MRSLLCTLNVRSFFGFRSAVNDLAHPSSEEVVQVLCYGIGLVSLGLSRFNARLEPGRVDAEPLALCGLR